MLPDGQAHSFQIALPADYKPPTTSAASVPTSSATTIVTSGLYQTYIRRIVTIS